MIFHVQMKLHSMTGMAVLIVQKMLHISIKQPLNVLNVKKIKYIMRKLMNAKN
jgi:hypothetical protein